jgi:hypothetical protein
MLALFRRINAGQPDLVLGVGVAQDCDGVAIGHIDDLAQQGVGMGLEGQQKRKNTSENSHSRHIGHQFLNRGLATKTTERLTMTFIDIGFYLPLFILVFKVANGGSLVTIKNIQIGSFRK